MSVWLPQGIHHSTPLGGLGAQAEPGRPGSAAARLAAPIYRACTKPCFLIRSFAHRPEPRPRKALSQSPLLKPNDSCDGRQGCPRLLFPPLFRSKQPAKRSGPQAACTYLAVGGDACPRYGWQLLLLQPSASEKELNCFFYLP